MKIQNQHQSPVTTLYLKTMNAVVEHKYFLIALLYFAMMFSALVLVQLSGRKTAAILPNRAVKETSMENTAVTDDKSNVAVVTSSAVPLTSCRIVTFSASR